MFRFFAIVQWANVYSAVIKTCVASLVLVPSFYWLSQRIGWVKPNWQGKQIPACMGFVCLPIWVFCLYWCEGFTEWGTRFASSGLAIFIIAFGILGLIDDVWGNRKTSGLKGHFRELFANRHLTTGALKAIGGFTLMLILWCWGVPNWRTGGCRFFVAATLILLCANSVNLLDVRPGRALKGASIMLLVALAFCLFTPPGRSPSEGTYYWVGDFLSKVLTTILVGVFMIPILICAPLDFRSKAMMGDAGSNALGALVGWYLALSQSFASQVIAVVLLLAFHLWTEKHSLTEFISRHPALDWLDRLGTGRPREDLPIAHD